MSVDFITGFFFETMKLVMLLSLPVLLCGLVTGVVVSIFQAATSINEMTLVFIPKMIAVGGAIVIFFPWMLRLLIDFTQNLIMNLPNYIQ
jgi:flagellar biosynthesis protein FliQ